MMAKAGKATERVLITGASSGLGRQLAIDYAKQGFQVFACGRNIERLQSLQHLHKDIHPLCFDVTDQRAVQNTLALLEDIPKLIILNAGDCEYINHGQLDSNLFRRVFESNFFGVINILETLQARIGAGTHIGIVSSAATHIGLPRAEAYGASKAALNYFTRSLAIDWQARKVSFSLIAPGFIKTPLTDKNDFPMPMLLSTEQASSHIRKGLSRKKPSIYFPWLFTAALKSLALLPARWQLSLLRGKKAASL